MKKLLLLVTLAATGCAHHPAKTFSPLDTAAVGNGLKSAAVSVHAAKTQADALYKTGAAAGSPELAKLQFNLNTADSKITELQKDSADLQRAYNAQIKQVNTEVQAQTDRAVKAETAATKILPHINRLRGFGVFVYFLGGGFARSLDCHCYRLRCGA